MSEIITTVKPKGDTKLTIRSSLDGTNSDRKHLINANNVVMNNIDIWKLIIKLQKIVK